MFKATTPMRTKRRDGFAIKGHENLIVTGLSICWGGKDAYYVSLQQEQADMGTKCTFSLSTFLLTVFESHLLNPVSNWYFSSRYKCKLSTTST